MRTPPLLMLAEGRKPRPRKVPTNRPKAIALHMAIAKVLREHCLPDWQWTAYSQRRSARQANGRQAQTHGRQGGLAGYRARPAVGPASLPRTEKDRRRLIRYTRRLSNMVHSAQRPAFGCLHVRPGSCRARSLGMPPD
jgi:hypothetical protein